ncbi:hypothetical protein EVJ58_g1912 [Rhodofomes roseus]|uniref:Uncharacterized protein n=1 Tax=Rhodofomes roseus TaxID=34475 RepID=A0A4Y9YZF0_9APHY|nr:hypothetical protein EVJ58_g1912 [Rhodofomes roseus]
MMKVSTIPVTKLNQPIDQYIQSAAKGRPRYINGSGIGKHRTRDIHISVVAAYQDTQGLVAGSTVPLPEAPAAPRPVLSLAEVFDGPSALPPAFAEAVDSAEEPYFAPMNDVYAEGSLYVDREGHPIEITAGNTTSINEQLRAQLADINTNERTFGSGNQWGAAYPIGIDFEDQPEADATIPDVIASLDFQCEDDLDEDDDEILSSLHSSHTDNQDWTPYGSKTMFMLNLLDNLPRLRMSDDHLKVFLWVMKECGTPDVPSFKQLRALQEKVKAEMNIKTSPHVSAPGNQFYATKPSETIRLDFANPLVRPHMSMLPRVDAPISEYLQGAKCLDMDDTTLDTNQLMWMDHTQNTHHHFYIKEVAALRDGQFVIPLRFLTQGDTDCFDGFPVEFDPTTESFTVKTEAIVRMKASDLHANVLDLLASGYALRFNDDAPTWTADMPHPTRKIAQGRATYTVKVMGWSDDVSGNKTKQYNAHTNVYVANVNLPHRKLQQEYFIRFCSTSQNATSSEQMEAFCNDMGPDKWHVAYDCVLGEEVLFRLIPHLLPADNPQQSEHCSHIGGKGKYPCRACRVGGSAEERETDAGYEQFFSSGISRSVNDTIAEIKAQLLAACLGVQDAVDDMQTQSGVKDKIAQHWIEILIPRARALQQERLSNPSTMDPRLRDRRLRGEERKTVRSTIIKEIQEELYHWLVRQPPDRYNALPAESELRLQLRPGDHFNILLSLPGLDVHRDTPCEILHTFLLGQDKYVWHKTHTEWDKRKEETFAIRLRSSSVDGLGIPTVRGDYIVRYKNGLVGKHFKVLQQVGVFHLYGGLCSDLVRDLWKATGELGAVLWFHTIDDMELYLADLEILIANVLDLWSLLDANRILVKNKLHVFAHLVEHVRRFGPAILYSTEIFECWNAIFRFCSILSNHHAPSHDIATTLAGMECFKHHVSGGWWRNSNGVFVQAGPEVRNFLKSNVELQRRLGWVEETRRSPGAVKLKSVAKQNPRSWVEAVAPHQVAPLTSSAPETVRTNSDDHPADINMIFGADEHTDSMIHRQWKECTYLVTQSGDICREGSWVFYKARRTTSEAIAGPSRTPASQATAIDEDVVVCAGHVLKILSGVVVSSPAGTKPEPVAIALIAPFDLASERDRALNMPVLTRSATSKPITPVAAADVLFVFNAQHDCDSCSCTATGVEPIIQERQTTTRTRTAIKHTDVERYLINMHALHNADLIRKTLPRSLSAPTYYYEDRQTKHQEFARGLRIVGPIKRAAAAAKAAETRARKKTRGSGE